MFDVLLNGGTYKVESQHKALALQAFKSKWGFEPEWEYTTDFKYVLLTL